MTNKRYQANDTDEYDMILVKQTDKAFLVRDEGNNEEWLPKSSVMNYTISNGLRDTLITFEAPAWIMKEKGFI